MAASIRAVYVYHQSAYEHWSQVLGRDDLAPGHFGETFTVEGMPDYEVCVGHRYLQAGAGGGRRMRGRRHPD